MRREISRADLTISRDIPDNAGHFHARVRDIRKQHMEKVKTTRFAHAMNKILVSRHFQEIILYSLCDGDVSHIREIASLANRQNIPFRVRTPKRSDNSMQGIFSLAGEPVEVI
jgi:2-C-methyl-D-erythritol 4-phosphate cytidylyltransferase